MGGYKLRRIPLKVLIKRNDGTVEEHISYQWKFVKTKGKKKDGKKRR